MRTSVHTHSYNRIQLIIQQPTRKHCVDVDNKARDDHNVHWRTRDTSRHQMYKGNNTINKHRRLLTMSHCTEWTSGGYK